MSPSCSFAKVYVSQPSSLVQSGHPDGSGHDDIGLAEVIMARSRAQEHLPSQEFALYLLLISTIGPEKNFLAQRI